jgi:hypothetical protein
MVEVLTRRMVTARVGLVLDVLQATVCLGGHGEDDVENMEAEVLFSGHDAVVACLFVLRGSC